MKKLLIIAITILVSAGVNAQTYSDVHGEDYTELISMNNSDVKYFVNNADYSVDELGKVSARIQSFYENGNLEEQGMLVRGKKMGSWTKFDEKGTKISEGSYSDDAKDGNWKVWDSNGVLRVEMNYDNGKRTGTWKMFDAEGKLINQQDYTN